MGQVLSKEPDACKGNWVRSVILYTVAALLSIGLAAIVLRLWRADLTLPFIHRSDAVFTSMCIKGIIENGWYLTNPRLGAPQGMNVCDYPMADNLHFLGLKLLSYLSSNWAVVQNLYFLLTFPLTSLSALFVFRRFHCSYLPSLLGSLLFTFLPYHFMRGEIHLFLASYYLVPLMIMLILEVYLNMPTYSLGMIGAWRARWAAPAASVLICLLVASAGVYYAFFGCFLLLVAGFSAWFHARKVKPLLKAAGLIMVLSGATAGNLYPTIAYRLQHGPNPKSAVRDPFHADVYGLKPIQLLLPVTDHRLTFFKKYKAMYNEAFRPLVNENDHSSLGIVGSLGFLLTLGRLLYRRSAVIRPDLRGALGILCLACLFLCTIGGLGSLFSLLISPMIRGYNRISVYIGFVSLFTIVLTLDRFSPGPAAPRRAWIMSGLVLTALLGAGIWDQTSHKFIPPYAWVNYEFNRDDLFIRALEERLPEGALVFQLPYACFPEQGPIFNMVDYDHLRCYLHSKHLRWSYGNIKGRAGDEWTKEVSSKPAEEMVNCLASAGFSGIYVDRAGFADSGAELENKLVKILQTQPLASRDGVLAFFDLSGYRRHLLSLHE